MHISNLKSLRARTTARRQRRQNSKAQNTIGSAEAHKTGAKLELNIASPTTSRHNDGAQLAWDTPLDNDFDLDAALRHAKMELALNQVEDDEPPDGAAELDNFLYELPDSVRLAIMTPALLKDESVKAYFDLMRLIARDMPQRGILGWLKLKEFTDYSWEIARYRRAEQHILTNVDVEARYLLIKRRLDALHNSLKFADEEQDASWGRNMRDFNNVIGLEDWTVDESATIGESFVLRSAELEQIVRLRTNAELRRDMILRELEERGEQEAVQRLRATVRRSETRIIESESHDVSIAPVQTPNSR